MTMTVDAVLALAPDEASAKAARGLLRPASWSSLGKDESAVWGACQGSGSKPYQAQVDLVGPAFQCSCPSRKFPCKHGLALLLLRVQDPARFSGSAQPPWVAEWIAGRREKAATKEQKEQARATAATSASDSTPLDAEAVRAARVARDERRWARIEAGAADLERWLGDVVQRGLAALTAEDGDAWRAFAARMVDAQAPGLANRLESAAEVVGVGADWPARILARLGVLQVTCDAIRNRAALPTATVSDLRTALGWPIDKDDIHRLGEQVVDAWTVVGLVSSENDRGLHERRAWLWGRRTGRRALVLEFAYGDASFQPRSGLRPSLGPAPAHQSAPLVPRDTDRRGRFATSWVVGCGFEGKIVYYPSASPVRALLVERDDASVEAAQWPTTDPHEELQELSKRLANNPWHGAAPLLVSGACVVAGPNDRWSARTAAHHWELEVGDRDVSLLLASSGGGPVSIWGEWTGTRLRPLTAWGGEGLWMSKGEVEG